MFATKARVEGQMVAEYGEHYAARVWAAIYRARKIVPIDENDLWSISHGIRSPHDLQGLHMFLSKLSVEVLHPPLDSQPISVKRL